jgi:hypothetical protein
MLAWLVGLGPAASGAGAGVAATSRAPWTPDDKAQLERGGILLYSAAVPGSDVRRVKAVALVGTDPASAAEVFTHYAAWRHFVPRMVESTVVRTRAPWHAWVRLRMDLPWPLGEKWVQAKYTHSRHGDEDKVQWWREAGTMRQFTGACTFRPWPTPTTALSPHPTTLDPIQPSNEPIAPPGQGGSAAALSRRSIVEYELRAEFDTIVPDAAVNKGLLRAGRSFVAALRQRVAMLRATGWRSRAQRERAAREAAHGTPSGTEAGEAPPPDPTTPAPATATTPPSEPNGTSDAPVGGEAEMPGATPRRDGGAPLAPPRRPVDGAAP